MTALSPLWPPGPDDPAALAAAYTTLLRWPLTGSGTEATGGELRFRCSMFDVVVMPFSLGHFVLARLEGTGPWVPVFATGRGRMTFLVRPATGHVLEGLPVAISSGPEETVVLPPGGERRWVVPPWSTATPEAVELVDAAILRPALEEAVPPCHRTS